MLLLAALCLLLLATISTVAEPLAPSNLQVEYLQSPVTGLDSQQPRFSYYPLHTERDTRQSAYQLVVRKVNAVKRRQLCGSHHLNCSALADDVVWDSTKVDSPQHFHITLPADKHLEADTRYSWSIQWYDQNNEASPVTESSFTTSLFATSHTDDAWHGAEWIDASGDTRQLRQRFTVPSDIKHADIVHATLYIVGLGTYIAWINEQRIAADQFQLPFTTFDETVLYDVYDVMPLIHAEETENVIAVAVGNGWYSQPTVKAGQRTVLYMLSVQMSDGRTHYISSNAKSIKTATGPYVMDDIYVGQVYDATKETIGWLAAAYDDSHWQPAQTLDGPKGRLHSATGLQPPIVKSETYTPVELTEPLPGVFVFKFPQTMAGITTLRIPSTITKRGQTITLQHTEVLYEDGTAQQVYSPVPAILNYTMRGDGTDEVFTPEFVYYGFQFVQMTGYPGTPTLSTLQATFIHSALPPTGNIQFSSPLLNKIQHATRSASLSNYINIPTDCPQRERRGWLADAHLTSDTTIHNFWMPAAYTKFLNDIKDAQATAARMVAPDVAGDVPECVPWYEHGLLPADPAWSAAYTVLTYQMYKYYTDTRMLEQHYDGVKMLLDRLLAQLEPDTHILTRSFFGDWCAGNVDSGCQYTSAMVSTFFVALQLRLWITINTAMNREDVAQHYKQQMDMLQTAINAQFYNKSANRYEDGVRLSLQTLHSLALTLGIVDDSNVQQVVQQMIDEMQHSDGPHVSAGIVGAKYVLPALAYYNRTDVALDAMMQTSQPSLGYMVEHGATTLWEQYFGDEHNSMGTKNHIMFGTQSAWYYQTLAGIQQTADSVGYRNILIKPYVGVRDNKLTSVDATIATVRGLIHVDWQLGLPRVCGTARYGNSFTLQCIAGQGTIDTIEFASFGQPHGLNCGEFSLGDCHSKSSERYVGDACKGQANCTIEATTQFFGRRDPCPTVDSKLKRVAVQVSGSSCYAPRLQVRIELPVGEESVIHMPLLDADPQHAWVVDMSNGRQEIVWQNDKYVRGSPLNGIRSVVRKDDVIELTVGSGQYHLALAVPSAPSDATDVDVDSGQASHDDATQPDDSLLAIE